MLRVRVRRRLGPNVGQPCGLAIQGAASLRLAQRTSVAVTNTARHIAVQQAEKRTPPAYRTFPRDPKRLSASSLATCVFFLSRMPASSSAIGPHSFFSLAGTSLRAGESDLPTAHLWVFPLGFSTPPPRSVTSGGFQYVTCAACSSCWQPASHLCSYARPSPPQLSLPARLGSSFRAFVDSCCSPKQWS